MNRFMKLAAFTLLLGTSATLFAQEAKDEPVYQITETVNV